MAEKSSVFDSIRIKSRRGTKAKPEIVQCGWEGCEKPGTHRAPKNRDTSGEFYNFCLEHVRKYNQSFNFFSQEDKEKKAQKVKAKPTGLHSEHIYFGAKIKPKRVKKSATSVDPGNLFARLAARSKGDNPDKKPTKRLMPADRNAIEVLGLKGQQSSVEIKTAYKALVKIHHPDANGGDKNSEERLRAIISAYTHLKQRGFL